MEGCLGPRIFGRERVNAIEVRNISKIYRLYRKPIDRLREAVFRRPLHQPFESLRNIFFTLPAGETLGIVGENGAGKSTLLKIIAGTVTPSAGELKVRGRVSALLELGAGFHPEFTGRQNIYLNASLQGLSEEEIRAKEKAIVGFAELGPFIDRPLKTYSSGMVVRLAFSVATSVDPDILIIDEALSVGDQYFQKKCGDRMISFRDRGKTLIFCSHNMYLVNQICRRAIWLDKGAIRQNGSATKVTAAYESYSREKAASDSEPTTHLNVKESAAPILVRSISLNGSEGPVSLGVHKDLHVILEYESLDDRPFWVALAIRRNDGLFCHAVSLARDRSEPLKGKGIGKVALSYPALPLLHGEYTVVGATLDESGLQTYHSKESASFAIVPPDEWRNEIGLLDLNHEWKIL